MQTESAELFSTVMTTYLQRKWEFTSLLIDPAALMDKSTNDNKAPLFRHQPIHTHCIRSITLKLTCSFAMISNSSASCTHMHSKRKGRRNMEGEQDMINALKHITMTSPACTNEILTHVLPEVKGEHYREITLWLLLVERIGLLPAVVGESRASRMLSSTDSDLKQQVDLLNKCAQFVHLYSRSSRTQ